MSSISNEQPPESFEEDQVEYISRLRVDINIALGQVQVLPPEFVLPLKAQNGTIKYFKTAILPEITEEGIWAYIGGIWKQLG